MLGLVTQLDLTNIFQKQFFRAIESNAYILRSANKGISAIVDNTGRVVKSLKNNRSGSLEYKLPLIKKTKETKMI